MTASVVLVLLDPVHVLVGDQVRNDSRIGQRHAAAVANVKQEGNSVGVVAGEAERNRYRLIPGRICQIISTPLIGSGSSVP